MRSPAILSWNFILLVAFAKPLPSDSLYNDFYLPEPEASGDLLFGNMASTDLSPDSLLLDESSSHSLDETDNLWVATSANGNNALLPEDGSQQSSWGQNPSIAQDSGIWISSCSGDTEVQQRSIVRIRADSTCPVTDVPLNFKTPTLPKLLPQNEIKPTWGQLQFALPPDGDELLCSVMPYEHHLCCDGPLGDEAMDFGDLTVFTPVQDCIPGKIVI